MAGSSKAGKQSVNLASSGVKVSRIRRDPPPAVKEKIVDLKERERWEVTVGVLAFALAIFVIMLGFGSYSGWSPRQYTLELNAAE
ncbi:MAG: hypothetical protein M3Q19_08950 [Pseudomonadota bacterium]|nr:hypothetical protein [Pseudomonadota bacterium]